jgi:formylglycine-generating enzyme required for sulfatase activity
MTDSDLSPAERLEAGDELDRLGWLPEDLYTFISIPGLSYPFFIGKYPVTNTQYQRFLEASDYAEPQFWRGFPKFDENCKTLGYFGEEGWQWLQNNWGSQKKRLPGYWKNPEFGIDRKGAPVVGVTWYEANAYCAWLKRHWGELAESRQNPRLTPKAIRLPMETEWVAAGGDEPQERFPWDAPGEATQDLAEVLRRANVYESGLGRTTPVWMYPLGASPHGIWDMAGNVWEWQANYYGKDHDWLVLRGGSRGHLRRYARCACRVGDSPVPFDTDLGFRVVLSPS